MRQQDVRFALRTLARQKGGGPEGDGRLDVHEIIGLHIASSLVFLSGCETALGPGAATDFGLGEDYATLDRFYMALKGDKPRGRQSLLWIAASARCQQKCAYCSADVQRDIFEEMTWEEILQVLDRNPGVPPPPAEA